MSKLLMTLALVLTFGSTACIIRAKPHHNQRGHAVKAKHQHEHCHKKGHNKRDHRKVCHGHVHNNGHH